MSECHGVVFKNFINAIMFFSVVVTYFLTFCLDEFCDLFMILFMKVLMLLLCPLNVNFESNLSIFS